MVLALAVLSSVTAGCGLASLGLQPQSQPKTWTNPPFKDSRAVEQVTPDANFDPTTANANTYTQVKVLDKSGKQVTLNASEHPLLFEAYWCPHCQRTLVMLNENRAQLKQFPIIVSMGFAPGTPLSAAIKLSDQELQTFHIANAKVYYLLDATESKKVVQSYPTMAFPYQSHLDKLVGEHTLQVWEQALNQK